MADQEVDAPSGASGGTSRNGAAAPMDVDSDSDSDKPLAVRKKQAAAGGSSHANGNGTVNGKRTKQAPVFDSDSSEDDEPLAKKVKNTNGKGATKSTPQRETSKAKVKEEDSDGDNEPLSRKRKASSTPVNATAKKARPATIKKEEDDDEKQKKKVKVEPVRKATPKKADGKKATVKKESPKGKTQKGVKKDEVKEEPKEVAEDERPSFDDLQHGKDWKTLEHNGVLFPPPYVPHGVKMKYDGKPVDLSPEAEEVATFFADVIGTQHAENSVFCANFFEDFLGVLKKSKKPTPIKVFEKCDFDPIVQHVTRLKEEKKNRSKEEKEADKKAKQELDAIYGWAKLNGKKEKVGNYRIEPPGLFRGRGKHPKTGHLKLRVQPEQITINIGEEAKVPEPPEGHKWKGVVHDHSVTWLATWKENINGSVKYVFLAANSTLKASSDLAKFNKSRILTRKVHKIRTDYTAMLKDKENGKRQMATAIYLIDHLALRAGHEKGEDEADTVGCCSLRLEHIALTEAQVENGRPSLTLDFLGKDSIRYVNTTEIDPQVFKNLRVFKRPPKKPEDMLFDRITTSEVNKWLTEHMEGLTAKVFRTHNASATFQDEIKKTNFEDTVNEKILEYNRANRRVAILCNHQRSISAKHHETVAKIADKIKALKYYRYCIEKKLMENDSSRKKKEHKQWEAERKKKVKKEEEVAVKVEGEDGTAAEEEDHKFGEDSLFKNAAMVREYLKEVQAQRIESANAVREELGLKPLKKFEEVEEWEWKRYEKLKGEWEKAKEAVDDPEEKKKVPKPAGMKKPPMKVEEEVDKMSPVKLESQLRTVNDQIHRQSLLVTDKEENKTTALGTSKLNYIDPRITYTWCKIYGVPVSAVFAKTMRDKFWWAEQAVTKALNIWKMENGHTKKDPETGEDLPLGDNDYEYKGGKMPIWVSDGKKVKKTKEEEEEEEKKKVKVKGPKIKWEPEKWWAEEWFWEYKNLQDIPKSEGGDGPEITRDGDDERREGADDDEEDDA
ncbi:DNA topoisomerase 1 [Rhizophlyctis rosea]|nr:DNA topoisomerase 1 [Rhizophlyctis rosea]